jgi:hypothetical protein
MDRLGGSPVFATMENTGRNPKAATFSVKYRFFPVTNAQCSFLFCRWLYMALRNGLRLPSALGRSFGQQCITQEQYTGPSGGLAFICQLDPIINLHCRHTKGTNFGR